MNTNISRIYRVDSPTGSVFYPSVESACTDNGLQFHTVKKIKGYPKVVGKLSINLVEVSISRYLLEDIINDLNANGGELPMPAGFVKLAE